MSRRYLLAQAIGDGTEVIPQTPSFCRCGCGQHTAIAKRTRVYAGVQLVRGEAKPYFEDHSSDPLARRRLFHLSTEGRTYIRTRDDRVEYWYRIVARNVLGRDLRANEIVHHINGDHTDDRAGNLAVISRADHPRVHYAAVPMPVEAIA